MALDKLKIIIFKINMNITFLNISFLICLSIGALSILILLLNISDQTTVITAFGVLFLLIGFLIMLLTFYQYSISNKTYFCKNRGLKSGANIIILLFLVIVSIVSFTSDNGIIYGILIIICAIMLLALTFYFFMSKCVTKTEYKFTRVAAPGESKFKIPQTNPRTINIIKTFEAQNSYDMASNLSPYLYKFSVDTCDREKLEFVKI